MMTAPRSEPADRIETVASDDVAVAGVHALNLRFNGIIFLAEPDHRVGN